MEKLFLVRSQIILKIEDEVWSDEEVYHTFTQEELFGPVIATQTKDNDYDTTDSEDIPLADLGRKKKQPVKRKLIQSYSESDHDDSADDENYDPNKDAINSTDSEFNVKKLKTKEKRRVLMNKQRETAWKKKTKKLKIRKKNNKRRIIRGQEHYDTIDIISNDSDAKRDTDPTWEVARESLPSTPNDESDHGNMPVETTPHKRASYRSPPKKHSSRKKTRNPEKWKRNVRKLLKSEGKEYVSATGRVVAPKKVHSHSCLKCRFKCSEKFTEE
ncbi:hypothetical protein DPMN_085614 [Dreissena polymorpha]|uniref:Uncharacterized protein n=1 Tax=Dreissena polymorpha TaxID=45954 RepID=A0A9D3YE22_DREPO|nr:hypothetical protein DPMN_085614 [Dreissena polymorpha]